VTCWGFGLVNAIRGMQVMVALIWFVMCGPAIYLRLRIVGFVRFEADIF